MMPSLAMIKTFLAAMWAGRRYHAIFDAGYLVRERDWSRSPGVQALVAKVRESTDAYRNLLGQFAAFKPWFEAIPVSAAAEDLSPRWVNSSFPGLDAVSVYGLLAINNPSLYVEVGSGNSTKFARRAISDHKLKTRIVSIDPMPLVNCDALCDQVIRKYCEDVDVDFFASLPGDTVLFVDNSHRCFANSDVTVFFMEILPLLRPGVIWGLHDIFFPFDYPEAWRGRYYNEQYLLIAYLMGGAGSDTFLLPNSLITASADLKDAVGDIFSAANIRDAERHGHCFWMKRRD